MTRKDYIKAVEIIRHIPDYDIRTGQARRWADYFESDNSRFDRDKFIAAVFKEQG